MLPTLLAVGLLATQAPQRTRNYDGPTAVQAPRPPVVAAAPDAAQPPSRDEKPAESLFVGSATPATLEDPTITVDDPLAVLSTDRERDGSGLLVTAGVFGGLSILSSLVVTVVSHSHVVCLRDESMLALVPCTEQVNAHRGAIGLASGLAVGGLPFLAAGAVRRGQFLSREGAAALSQHQLRARRIGGSVALVGGLGALATSLGVVGPVLLGTCKDSCASRAISSQVLWWTGAISAGVGTAILALAHGRTHPEKPRRRIRLRPGVSHRSVGASISGEF